MCNYSKELRSYLDGQTSIANIARSLIEAGATPEELGGLESDIQYMYDNGDIDDKKIASINSGLQRETKRYSVEQFDKELKIGVKVKGEVVTVGRVNSSRNRQPNKPKDETKAGKAESLQTHIEAIAALCSGFEVEQKKDVVKLLADALGMKAAVSEKK